MISTSLNAQSNVNKAKYDTIALSKGSVILFKKKSITAYNDTVVLIPKKTKYTVKNISEIKTTQFYDSLKIKSERNFITKELYDILITRDAKDTISDETITKQSEDEYKAFNGKKIRNIKIKRLEAFGTSVMDTTMKTDAWLGKAANDIHILTFEKVIRGNLFVKKGDKLNSYLLAENERILRSLPFIYEAKIYATKVKHDSVDLLIVTRDLFSIGIKPDIGTRKGNMELYDLNFVGFGNELSNKVFYDLDSSQHHGYRGEYKFNNIKNTFINAGVFYQSMYDVEKFGIYADRSFITTQTKYAGGFSLSRSNELIKPSISDPNLNIQALSYNNINFWWANHFL